MSDENFLSRWSRRKSASKAPSAAGTAGPAADGVAVTTGTPSLPADTAAATTGTQVPAPAGIAAPAAAEEPPKPLPPVDSLTPESDFAAFMKPGVDPGLKRQAFKKLIEDPQFNVMDGLDVYIDDYSKPDPLPEGWLEKMNQMKHLGIFKEAQPAPDKADAASPDTLQSTMHDEAPPAQIAPPPAETPDAVPLPEVGKTEVSPGGK